MAYRSLRSPGVATLILVLGLCWTAAPVGAASGDLPDLLPRDLEIELALSALPEAVRSGASVWLLERGGYVRAREGSNGFSCLVRRSGAVPGAFDGAVLPICYDRVGSETLLPAVLDEVRMLEAGDGVEAVAAAIENGWSDGTYRVPGPGVAYMLSPVFCLRGRCGQYVPHTMFYAPFESGEGIGANEDVFDHVPSMQAPGTAAAMAVIPVGEPARTEIFREGQELRERVWRFLGIEGDGRP